jgi:hypothetical protein
LRYAVCEKGFRSRQVMLVTTLLDPIRYPHDELARLYGLRWQIEICQPYCLQSKRFYELPFCRLGTVRSAA